MPRPPIKRPKLNIPNQAAKRAVNNPLSSSPSARRRHLQEQLAHKNIGHVANDSDDSDLLVVKSRNPRNGRGVPRQEIYGSGGVAAGDKVAAHMSPSKKRQRLSPKEVSRPQPQTNGIRKNASLRSSGLRPIDHLSTSRSAQPSSSNTPGAGVSSPAGLKSSISSQVRSQETPVAERSILGPIKIRTRQPSILRLIESPESPILDQDLDDFLPEDESTPLHSSRKRKLSSTPAVPAESQTQKDDLKTGSEIRINGEPDLPLVPLPATPQRRQPLAEIHSDTLAPPRSSSTAPSPVRPTPTPPTRNKANTRKSKQPKSLSTAALQALMPARRQQRTRRDRVAKSVSEFDIPEDDSSDQQKETTKNQTGDPDEEESYITSPRPARRGKKLPQPTKPQKKKPPAIRKPTTKDPQSLQKGGVRGQRSASRSQPRNRSLNSTQSPPPPKSRSTPAAKTSSSSTQQSHHAKTDRTNNTSYSQRTDADGAKNIFEQGEVEDEEDKENRPSALSANSSAPGMRSGRAKRTRKPKSVSKPTDLYPPPPPPPTSDHNREHDDQDIDIELSRSPHHTHHHPNHDRDYDHDHDDEGDGEISRPLDPLHDEQARLAQKFREVDEWELEFEDVSFDVTSGGAGSSDAMAR